MRTPQQDVGLNDGSVITLRADHLAIYDLEQVTGRSLVTWLGSVDESRSAAYDLVWCLTASWREDHPGQLTLRQFLRKLPVGEAWVELSATATRLIFESLPKPKEGGSGNVPPAPPASTGSA